MNIYIFLLVWLGMGYLAYLGLYHTARKEWYDLFEQELEENLSFNGHLLQIKRAKYLLILCGMISLLAAIIINSISTFKFNIPKHGKQKDDVSNMDE